MDRLRADVRGQPVHVAGDWAQCLGQPSPLGEEGAENGVGPLVLMSTDRLGEALAVVKASGGRIVSEPYRYPGGSRFHVADPSGNVIGIYQSDQG